MKYRIVVLFVCFQVLSAAWGWSQPMPSFFSLIVDDQWKFSTGDSIAWADLSFNDDSWDTISCRQYWEEQGYKDYNGYGWYRQHFTIPSEWKEQIISVGGVNIRYEYADDVDEVYVNGKVVGKIGEFPPDFKPVYGSSRKFTIPADLIRFDKENLIAIRVYDKSGNGGLKTANIELRSVTPMDDVRLDMQCDDSDWVFQDTKTITFFANLKVPSTKDSRFNLKCKVTTDDFCLIDTLSFEVTVHSGGNFKQEMSFTPSKPGFYRVTLYAEQNGATSEPLEFNMGYNPEQILSPVDSQADFDEFWNKTLNELASVKPNFKMSLLEERSQKAKNIYHVEMHSLGGIKIEGYYAVPKKAGRYPVILSFLGYGSGGGYPNPDNLPEFCELILSARGQGIQLPVNTYGQWITYGLQSKETYYYRGAYMDLVRGVDFLCSRPEIDVTKIFAEGGSQGGAFTLAVCALDKRIRAGAPYIPFLSDFPDYFKIASWPGDLFETYIREHPDSNMEQVCRLLSYFDIKNLAHHISCPIIMGVGLQDNVCPPHINFSGYNQINAPKSYYVYPDKGHTVGKSWWGIRNNFFKSFCGDALAR